MAGSKKPAKLAIDRKSVSADQLTSRRCAHCDERIPIGKLIVVKAIRFTGARTQSRFEYYIREHHSEPRQEFVAAQAA
jgi:hypothetical protein